MIFKLDDICVVAGNESIARESNSSNEQNHLRDDDNLQKDVDSRC